MLKIENYKKIDLISDNKKIIILFFLIFFLSNIVYASEKENLIDIKDHWANKEINILIKENIVEGYSDNTFRPNNPVKINEILKMIVIIADYKLETSGERWPNWYIQTAIKNDIISSDEFENYNRNISRYEVAKIIGNYIDLKDVENGKNIFKDLNKAEKDIVLKLVKLNVISGYEDNTFRSDNLITRAEACKIIINAYNAKQKLLEKRTCSFSSQVTNLYSKDENEFDNTYEIKNNRIFIYDDGRYAKLEGQTLNQEYINDKKVINVLKKLVGPNSYTELKFVPDKYIINNLNICYGNTKADVKNGNYIFEIRFYENAYYDVSKSKDNSSFINDACIKIKTGKMWDKNFENDGKLSCNEKNLYKLKEAIGEILDDNIENKFIEYFIKKRIQASDIPNSDNPKISESIKIGKYVINTFCIDNNDLEFYIQKF